MLECDEPGPGDFGDVCAGAASTEGRAGHEPGQAGALGLPLPFPELPRQLPFVPVELCVLGPRPCQGQSPEMTPDPRGAAAAGPQSSWEGLRPVPAPGERLSPTPRRVCAAVSRPLSPPRRQHPPLLPLPPPKLSLDPGAKGAAHTCQPLAQRLTGAAGLGHRRGQAPARPARQAPGSLVVQDDVRPPDELGGDADGGHVLVVSRVPAKLVVVPLLGEGRREVGWGGWEGAGGPGGRSSHSPASPTRWSSSSGSSHPGTRRRGGGDPRVGDKVSSPTGTARS